MLTCWSASAARWRRPSRCWRRRRRRSARRRWRWPPPRRRPGPRRWRSRRCRRWRRAGCRRAAASPRRPARDPRAGRRAGRPAGPCRDRRAPEPRAGVPPSSGLASCEMSACCGAGAAALPLMPWSIVPCCWATATASALSLRTLAPAAASIGAAPFRFAATARSTGAARSSPRSTFALTSSSDITSLSGSAVASFGLDLAHRDRLEVLLVVGYAFKIAPWLSPVSIDPIFGVLPGEPGSKRTGMESSSSAGRRP